MNVDLEPSVALEEGSCITPPQREPVPPVHVYEGCRRQIRNYVLRSYEDLRNKESMVGRDSLTERELDIMSVLWRKESGTVSEVREGLADEP